MLPHVLTLITARKRSLGQGNIFSSVCQEFYSQGGSASVHAGIPYSLPDPEADTPQKQTLPGRRHLHPWKQTPTHPPEADTHPTLQKQTPHPPEADTSRRSTCWEIRIVCPVTQLVLCGIWSTACSITYMLQP